MSENDQAKLALQRMHLALGLALQGIEALDKDPPVHVVAVPHEGKPTRYTFHNEEALVNYLQEARQTPGLGWLFVIKGEHWPIRIQPDYAILPPGQDAIVLDPGIPGAADEGALFVSAPPPIADPAAPPASETVPYVDELPLDASLAMPIQTDQSEFEHASPR